MAVTLQIRGDTTANWQNFNPVLAEREFAINTDNNLYKIGNGVTHWNDLPYRELSAILDVSTLNAQSDPPTAPINALYLYAQNVAGKMLLKHKGPSGVDYALQPALFNTSIQMMNPGSTTVFTYIGMVAPTIVGTVSHPALVATYKRTQMRRGIITSAVTANASSEMRSITTSVFRGNQQSMGGFFVSNTFAVSSTTANQQCAVGLFSTIAAIATTQVPSLLTDCIFAGYDATDTNLQIMSNAQNASCQKINLGNSFPAADPTAVYEVIFFARQNDTQVYYRVTNITTGATVSGSITNQLYLPSQSTFLAWHTYVNNGGTAAAVVLEFMRMYLETVN